MIIGGLLKSERISPMRKLWLVTTALALTLLVPFAEAQRTGGGRPSGAGQGQGQGQMSGQAAGQQGMGSGQQQTAHAQQQMKIRSQATDQQRTAMKQSMTATKELRSQLRTMTRLEKGRQIGTDEAKQWRERMRQQITLMQQQQQQLIASLSTDQQAWVAEDLQEWNEATSSLVDFLQALSVDLEEEEVDEQAVKKDAKKADEKAKKVESEESQILAELELD